MSTEKCGECNAPATPDHPAPWSMAHQELNRRRATALRERRVAYSKSPTLAPAGKRTMSVREGLAVLSDQSLSPEDSARLNHERDVSMIKKLGLSRSNRELPLETRGEYLPPMETRGGQTARTRRVHRQRTVDGGIRIWLE
jgi:hypothetical protein